MGTTAKIFLLIEDDPDDVHFMRHAFKSHQRLAKLTVVSDGIEGMRYLEGSHGYQDRSANPVPDVILLDLKMPRFSGFDFLSWLRTKASHPLRYLPVVVFSSSDLPSDVLRAYALGVNAYMVKPTSYTLLGDRLNTLLSYWIQHAETPVLTGLDAKPATASMRTAISSQ